MLTRRVIPCLDIKDGRIVKGIHFENLKDAGDPAEAAERYEQEGADEICFLDITASVEGRGTLLDVVSKTADRIATPLTVGGGVHTQEDVRLLLRAGADKVAINTAAVRHPECVRDAAILFGRSTIVVAIDAKRNASPQGWEVYTHGGRHASGLDVIAWAKQVEALGAGEILLTSMDRDGTKDGYDLALTQAVAESVGIPVIASGGVGAPTHLSEGILIGKADAVLAASIFHYRTCTVWEAKQEMAARGIPVRLLSHTS